MFLTRYIIVVSLLRCRALAIAIEHKSYKVRRALQKEHEKPQAEKWADAFLGRPDATAMQVDSMIRLLHTIALKNFDECTTMILYDSSALTEDKTFIELLLNKFPLPFVHGKIENHKTSIATDLMESTKDKCVSYILLLKDVMRCKEVIGKKEQNKVVIVARSSQWRVHEFLSSDASTVVPYILYTHELYIDGLGSSKPHILTSWTIDKFTRPEVNLFPRKMVKGFAGHRFITAIAEQPPYVIKKEQDSNDEISWDGVEVRLLQLLSETLNYTIDFHEAKDIEIYGPGDAVAKVMREGKANLGISGLYVTQERMESFEMSHLHTQDCAVFLTLTSTALPRHRAILGPFQLSVWISIIMIYLFAIFPIYFSDSLSITYLIKNPQEIENMFWYVFGTFTNCFSFTGENSWNNTKKASTRLFIGFYWLFTIIITACYTGSIIAFVTLPVFPSTVDTVDELISGRYQTGTLDRGGWQYWFENSTDEQTNKLFKNIEFLPTVQAGLKNITGAWLWPYAFLGSRDQLDYIVRTNFTSKNKRSVLHISSECFSPFAVAVGFPKSSIYKQILNSVILRAFQSGLILKMKNDVEWEMYRSATGKLLQANSVGKTRVKSPEDRSLTLADTQGMFLLLGVGFILGGAFLISEWLGGCLNYCKTGQRSRTGSVVTNNMSLHFPTPMDTINNKLEDEEHNDTNKEIEIAENPIIIVHEHPSNGFNYEENVRVERTDSEDSSSLDFEITKMFDFDSYLGEDSSVISDDPSHKFQEELQDE